VIRFDTVSFLSDFGTVDEFVGVVKAVIRDIARHVTVIDITHEIAPHDVRGGSFALARSIQYLPSGVVLAVVDPGVGTDRRAVAIEVADGEGILVGPDNGLLPAAATFAGGAERAVVLDNPAYHLPSPGLTFGARDVFGPVAAHLCNGVALLDLGTEIDPALLRPGLVPLPRFENDAIVAEVLWVDRFGNAQLNVGPAEIEPWGDRVRVRAGDNVRTGKVCASYGEIGTGALGLVVDSYGMVSVCLDRFSAADELHLAAGDAVELSEIAEDDPGGVTTALPVPRSR
jgi:S-adenosyl-L-methionine hydrolase (adenosine-forming)